MLTINVNKEKLFFQFFDNIRIIVHHLYICVYIYIDSVYFRKPFNTCHIIEFIYIIKNKKNNSYFQINLMLNKNYPYKLLLF